MRILIGYDGSKHSDAALEDLKLAGLPHDTICLVVSVADALAGAIPAQAVAQAMPSGRVFTTFNRPQTDGYESEKEAGERASHAAERLASYFPGWEIESRVRTGPAAWELIEAANDWSPDLIIVGPEGRNAEGRIVLGSVSERVVMESSRSVRVARDVLRKKKGGAPKIIVGIDGSHDARAAVDEVSRRSWPEGTQIRLIVAHDRSSTARLPASLPASTELVTRSGERAAERAESMLNWANAHLKSIANVSVSIQRGDPKRVLIGEARRWRADSIFLGSRDFSSGFERFKLGSVSTAVVANAPCSVEVVRAK